MQDTSSRGLTVKSDTALLLLGYAESPAVDSPGINQGGLQASPESMFQGLYSPSFRDFFPGSFSHARVGF